MRFGCDSMRSAHGGWRRKKKKGEQRGASSDECLWRRRMAERVSGWRRVDQRVRIGWIRTVTVQCSAVQCSAVQWSRDALVDAAERSGGFDPSGFEAETALAKAEKMNNWEE